MVTPVSPDISAFIDIYREISRTLPENIKYDKSPKLDFEVGDFIVENGNFMIAENKDNLRQWVSKTLATPINNHAIYEREFGNALNNYLGRLPNSTLVNIVAELLRDVLFVDNRIKSVINIKYNVDDSVLYVTFEIIAFDDSRFVANNQWSLY